MKKILILMMMLKCGGAFAQCSLGPISGSNVLCPPSYTTTLSNGTSGGTWTTGDGGCITIDPSSGVVTGVCGGVETVTYTVGSCSVYYNVGSAAIIGPASGAICSGGSSVTMSNVFGGGTWSTTSSDISITSGGVVTVAGGFTGPTTPATIDYAPPISTGCSTATTNIIVDLSPSVTGLSCSLGSTACEWNAPFNFTTTMTGGSMPFTYNWWWGGGTFASNSAVYSTTSIGYQMGGIELSQFGYYETNVVDYYGCISPPATGHSISLAGGCKPISPYLGVGVTATVGPLTLLPNPNNGSFTISGSADFMTGAESIKAEIVDITGHLVLAQVVPVTNGSISQPIQLHGNAANGLYFVKLSAGAQSQVLRLSLER